MKRAIITVGLGFGDCGKGAWTDYLCRKYDASLVVRYSGGSQCGHNVQLADGHRHTFSQFGAGTFAGVRTFIAPSVIVNLAAIEREADAIRQYGIVEPRLSGNIEDSSLSRAEFPYNMLMVSDWCLVSTVFHRGLNQLKELLRGRKRHGSVGHGIGEVRSYWLKYGNDAITIFDIADNIFALHKKLVLLKARLKDELSLLPYNDQVDVDDFLGTDPWEEAEQLTRIGRKMVRMYTAMPTNVDTVVFEGAQGVLLDEWNGFHPYTTWSTVTPENALEIASRSDDLKELCVLGLTRTYATRHGEGPFPTFDDRLTKKLEDRGNPPNMWQGAVRCGWLDLPLLKYAAKACKRLDGILLSHCDQMDIVNKMCIGYDTIFDPPSSPNLARQEILGKALNEVWTDLVDVDLDKLVSHVQTVAPVVGYSYGPRASDHSLDALPLKGVA